MSEQKPNPSRPSLVSTRRPVDQSKLQAFANDAGKPAVVMPDPNDLNPQPAASAPASSTAQTEALSKPGKIPYVDKIKPNLFRMTAGQNALFEAVYAKTTYKSKQELFENEFIPRLEQMAKDLGIDL